MTLPQDTTIDLNLAFYDARMYGSCAATFYEEEVTYSIEIDKDG